MKATALIKGNFVRIESLNMFSQRSIIVQIDRESILPDLDSMSMIKFFDIKCQSFQVGYDIGIFISTHIVPKTNYRFMLVFNGS